MPLCPYCHTVVSQDTRFCPECGKALENTKNETETAMAEMKRDLSLIAPCERIHSPEEEMKELRCSAADTKHIKGWTAFRKHRLNSEGQDIE